MATRGTYIVIEGTDGTGKSTQASLLASRLAAEGHEVIEFHEPDGVPIAAELRNVIKNGSLTRSALTNVLLFTAARRENWLQQGMPVLERGGYVIAARNYYSTLAYQGIAEGLERDMTTEEDIAYIEMLTRSATNERYMSPDFACILDIDDETERARRIAERGELRNPDTFESRGDDFQQQVIDAYRQVATSKNIPIISAAQTPAVIAEVLWNSAIVKS